jgi:23S rRNA pseudouridine2605 synthase
LGRNNLAWPHRTLKLRPRAKAQASGWLLIGKLCLRGLPACARLVMTAVDRRLRGRERRGKRSSGSLQPGWRRFEKRFEVCYLTDRMDWVEAMIRTRAPQRPTEPAERPRDPRERVAKVIARAGLCSRREAEAFIAAGRVCVNGAVIASPALNVSRSDTITVDGQALPPRERTRLFLYHKPRGLVTTNADSEKRPTIFATLPSHLPRLVSVGRLDLATEGLLLLTNDGGLARMLELPQTGWLRRYRVRAHGHVTQPQLDTLGAGITIDAIHYGPIEATLDRQQGSNVWLTMAIREGKNREVRNVLGALGLTVNRLIRISFGPFQLGDLPEGGIQEVKTRTLREQIGERIAAMAGADFDAPPITSPSGSGRPAANEVRRPPPKKARSPADKKGDQPRGAGRLPDRQNRDVAADRIDLKGSRRPRSRDRARGPRPSRPAGKR